MNPRANNALSKESLEAYSGRRPESFWRSFWMKVDRTEGCWNWIACRTADGAGTIRFGMPTRKHILAHRAAYVADGTKSIPAGHDVRRTCRNPACVRPEHLQAVEVG